MKAKKLQLLISVGFFFTTLNLHARTWITDLACEHLRFSWRIVSDQQNVLQAAYEIKVFSEANEMVWSTGRINSNQSVQINYTGPALLSNKKYYWQSRVWDNQNNISAWSETVSFQTTFFDAPEWKAKWITPGYNEDAQRASPLFRKEFSTSKKKIINASVYITAHGLYEAKINGKKIGDAYLTPGWTSYTKRLQYQVYDVTDMIKQGANAIGVTLGNGWYRGYLGWEGKKDTYGKDIALLFQLNIRYADGTTKIIRSDSSWKTSTGSIVYSEIYNGEIIDGRKEKKRWDQPNYIDRDWANAKEAGYSTNNLIATENEPVKRHETFKPIKIITTPKGEQVIDFGQNLVGWVMVKLRGRAGDTIKISHAEVLDKNGNFYTDNLRLAKAQDMYILKDGTEENFEPHFTWHGFRFIKVEGCNDKLNAEDFTAVALYSDMKETGSFSCSDPLINQLQHNIVWGQKGNFLDVPTDCPQRDERLGWTGDAQVFARTASFNMNVNKFFSKWMKDVAADQRDGVVPFVVPNILGGTPGSAGWADVATVVPWTMYLVYGNKKILEDQYESMKAHVESIRQVAVNHLWNTGFHFGDWLFYRPDDDNDGRSAVTDKYLIAQCFYAHSTQLLINAAKVLDREDDVNNYSALLQKIKDAFVKEYVTANGKLISGTQTAYVLALGFDLLTERSRIQAALTLVDNIKSYGYHLTTGFLGTPYICEVLTRFGYIDIAYKLLLQETYPSWLYPIKTGATTIWERWDGIKADSSFETPEMNSFNHYAYGSVGDWLYRTVAGIDTYEDEPGYKHNRIWPHPGGGLTYVNADLETVYGKLSSHWRIENNRFLLDVAIPVNTYSEVYIPASSAEAVRESGHRIQAAEILNETFPGCVHVHLGSGTYHFAVSN